MSARWLVLGVLALVAWLLGEQWIQSDPGDPVSGYLTVLVGVPASLAAWCFAWALGSKLFTRQFDFPAHLRWALSLLLITDRARCGAAAAGLRHVVGMGWRACASCCRWPSAAGWCTGTCG